MCRASLRPTSPARSSASRATRRHSTVSATATSASTAAGGSFVLKVGNPADAAGTVEMQVLAMEHALTADPGVPIAHPRRTVDGRPTGSVTIEGDRARRSARRVHRRRRTCRPALQAPPCAARSVPPWRVSTRRSPGSRTRSRTAPCSGTSPALPELRPKLAHLAAGTPRLVERALDRYEDQSSSLRSRSSPSPRSTGTSTPATSSSAGTTRSASRASSTSAISSTRGR